MQLIHEDGRPGRTLLDESIVRTESPEKFFDAISFAAIDSEASENSFEYFEICDSYVASTALPSLSCSTASLVSLSSNENESPTPSSLIKKLTFGQVKVHQHNITIGDNPSCSHGPPISLDWALIRSDSYNLDEYEAMAEASRGKAKRLGRLERETLLQESGFSTHTLIRISEQIDHAHMMRTVEKMQLNAMEEYQVMATASIRSARRTNDSLPATSTWKSQVKLGPRLMRLLRKDNGKPRQPGDRHRLPRTFT